MQFLPFLILATLAYCVLSGGWWGWMRAPGVVAYAPFANGFGLFVLACERPDPNPDQLKLPFGPN